MVLRWWSKSIRVLQQDFCTGLRGIGLDARLSDHCFEPWCIEIFGSPIRWCKVGWRGSGDNSKNTVTYGVPDHRIRPNHAVATDPLKLDDSLNIAGLNISVRPSRWSWVRVQDFLWRQHAPSRSLYESYERIARHILDNPIPDPLGLVGAQSTDRWDRR